MITRALLASKYVSGVAEILDTEPARVRTVFVPTAGSAYDTASWIAVEREWLTRNGFPVEDLELATASPELVAEKLSNADMIYVAGGNTYFLLEHMQRTRFWKALEHHNPIYVGVSAGAIVTCPDIAHIADLDERELAPGLADTTAAGLVDFSILPHVDYPKVQDKITAILSHWPDGKPLVKLNDDEAIVLEVGNWRIVKSGADDLS
ncbi:MAG: type 1 glutamine amidotransferase-like domain-containing protein [Corynebacteriales bacterium]|nr:type 1 glutamine amidotransferase-like domain-containing protein [Mycobacteriales bacterium]